MHVCAHVQKVQWHIMYVEDLWGYFQEELTKEERLFVRVGSTSLRQPRYEEVGSEGSAACLSPPCWRRHLLYCSCRHSVLTLEPSFLSLPVELKASSSPWILQAFRTTEASNLTDWAATDFSASVVSYVSQSNKYMSVTHIHSISSAPPVSPNILGWCSDLKLWCTRINTHILKNVLSY